jgi:hypothetical protein
VNGRELKRVLKLHERLDRLWSDDRFEQMRGGHDVRQLAEALIWASHRRVEDPGVWVARKLGHESWRSTMILVVAKDAPRYSPPDRPTYGTAGGCPVPKTRGPKKGEPCGRSPSTTQRRTDPATGQWEYAGYCREHDAYSEALSRAEQILRQSGNVPEPAPNVGGLLPCHTWVSNWPDLYARAAVAWKPPKLGICADDWPTMAKVEQQATERRAKLAVVAAPASAEEIEAADGGGSEVPPPILTLVREEESDGDD